MATDVTNLDSVSVDVLEDVCVFEWFGWHCQWLRLRCLCLLLDGDGLEGRGGLDRDGRTVDLLRVRTVLGLRLYVLSHLKGSSA